MNRFIAIVISAMTLASASPVARSAEKAAHLEAAEQLVREVQPENNEYAYDGIFIKWKGDAGVTQYEARCDCSGLVTLLLEHVYGYKPATLKAWTGHSRPLAKIYHDQIEAEHGFKKISDVKHIQPGDILAVKYEEATRDTGHVMIVAEAPRLRKATEPIEPATQQWDVLVIDSSKSGHGPDDTRRKPDKTFYNGVGRGTVRVYTNAKGEIVGDTWSTLKASEFYPTEKHHMVAGRLKKDFKP